MATLEAVKNELFEEELLRDLRRISGEMVEGSIDAFYELRERVPDSDALHGLSEQLEEETLAILWLLREFVVGNLWANFGGGTLGFPKQGSEQYIAKIVRGLGKLIQSMLTDSPFAEDLGMTVGAYYGLVRLCQSKAGRPFREEEWGIL